MKELIKKIRLKVNKIGSKRRNKKIKNKDITILSNNCWAGITYQYLNLRFNSPTIGLYFMAEEYIDFLENLDECITGKIEFISYEQSKYKDYLIERQLKNMIIGKLNNKIEVFFLHYKTIEEAKEKWEKRCKRIDKNNMIVKFNDQNNCSLELLNRFEKLSFKNKICFTAKNYLIEGITWIKKYKNKEFVTDDLYSYHKYLNIINYINNIS